jgi:hypothetical protein
MIRFPLLACCVLIAALVSAAHAQTYSLVIGIDGMGAYGFEAANTPNMHSIKDGTWASGYRGASSLFTFAGGTVGTPTEQPTVSGPGWSSVQTGVWKNDHGVTENDVTFTNGNFLAFPSYLKLVESQFTSNVQTSGIVSWNAINTNIFATSGIDSRTPTSGNDAAVATAAVSQLSNLSNRLHGAMFAYFGDVDHAGHESGAYSPEYHAATAGVDTRVGQLLTAIRSRSSFANENWQIVLITDHGHRPAGGHGGQTALERTIPLLVSSKTVTAGSISTSLVAPSQIDVATTVLDHFGIAPPAYMLGQSRAQNATPLATTNITSGLVSHISFDGNANGSIAGNGGTVIGNVQFVAGRFGQAGRVGNYGSGSVLLNDDLGTMIGGLTDLAVSMWVKYDSATSNPAFFSNKNWNSGGNLGINLAYQPNSGQGGLDANVSGSRSGRFDIEPYSGFEPGNWHNVVLNVDRDGTTSVYVDGALFGANSAATGFLDGEFNFRLFNDGTGSYSAGAGFTNLMIDEFSAWNRLLTPDEIAFLSTSAVTAPSGPAGDFNHDGSVNAADYILWRNGLGSTYSQNDYNLWRNNFGATGAASGQATSEGPAAAVPEPIGAITWLGGVIALLAVSGRHNRCSIKIVSATGV